MGYGDPDDGWLYEALSACTPIVDTRTPEEKAAEAAAEAKRDAEERAAWLARCQMVAATPCGGRFICEEMPQVVKAFHASIFGLVSRLGVTTAAEAVRRADAGERGWYRRDRRFVKLLVRDAYFNRRRDFMGVIPVGADGTVPAVAAAPCYGSPRRLLIRWEAVEFFVVRHIYGPDLKVLPELEERLFDGPLTAGGYDNLYSVSFNRYLKKKWKKGKKS